MNKKILGILVSLLVVAILTLPMSAAYATKPIPLNASREFTGIRLLVEGRWAGESGNRMSHIIGIHEWTGDIVGFGIADDMRFYPNLDPSIKLPVRVHSLEVIGNNTHPATVLDEYVGTLTMRKQFYKNDDGNYKGTWVIISGTGDLVNLRGQGTYLPNGDITGKVHFDP